MTIEAKTEAGTLELEQQLVEAARAVEPVVLAHADEAERIRTQPQPVIDAFHEAELFKTWLPKSRGGFELAQTTYTRVLEEVSRQDGSAGWTLMIGMANNSFAGWLPEEGAAEIYGPRTVVGASIVGPGATVTRVEGGFRVSGRWTLASGIPHSDWAAGAIDAPPLSEGGPPQVRLFFFPPGGYQVIDTWESGGLRGTGSHDFAVNDVFVPSRRMFDFFGPPTEPGVFWKLGFPEFLQMAHTGQALGSARGIIDVFKELAATSRADGQSAHSVRPIVQIQLGEAEATLRAARAWVFEVLEEIWARGEEGRTPTREERALITLCVGHCVQSCIRVADLMYSAGGSKSLYTAKRLERFWRDLHAAGQHVSAAPQQYHNQGAVLLGLPHPML